MGLRLVAPPFVPPAPPLMQRLVPILAVVVGCALHGALAGGELLPNGIRLPDVWPPDVENRADLPPLRPPYLVDRPAVVPIDVGRQLFVDDFLIERSTLTRVFHRPQKFEGNPVLRPEKPWEQGAGLTPMAAPFSDGAFYDPQLKRFRLWYSAGWYDRVALAESEDGVTWTRPELDVVPGTNLVAFADRPELRRDNVSVWLDHETTNPNERYKMTAFARTGEVGGKLDNYHPGLLLLTSPDGVHWTLRGETPLSKDNTTMFYNPFRKQWVFSHRIHVDRRFRARAYWESADFLAAAGDGFEQRPPVFWSRADRFDRPDPQLGQTPQVYKIDATPYESIMLGLFEMLYGPPNEVCAATGTPKITEIQVAYSRDGFHWDRPDRRPFIAGTRQADGWERGYISSCGGGCLVVGDELWFYYGAFRGDEANRHENPTWSGMYAHASTGLAKLRRDGFASLRAGDVVGEVTTRPVRFSGKHLLINADAKFGELRAEVLDETGRPIEPFTLDKCRPLTVDSTRVRLAWDGGDDLSAFAGKPVRFRFQLRRASLFAFWVSPDASGASYGYTAAGGPGLTGAIDTVGDAAKK